MFHLLRTPWFKDVLDDLALLLSFIRVHLQKGVSDPVLQSSSTVTDDRDWVSLHPYRLHPDHLGLCLRTPLRLGTVPQEVTYVKSHVRGINSWFVAILRRDRDTGTAHSISQRACENEHSKAATLATL